MYPPDNANPRAGNAGAIKNVHNNIAINTDLLQGQYPHWGATQEEWCRFDIPLGLTEDLLPVVSNANAAISPQSNIKTLGKTPSRYNHKRKVAGIPNWTNYHATGDDIKKWMMESDYGICLQTRDVRALDIDIPDPFRAKQITDYITSQIGSLPARIRSNSGKCLLAFRIGGTLDKRKIVCEGGIIEFLANGQQFIACGTHSSGVRYEWDWNGHADFPEMSLEQFEALWQGLVERYAIEPEVTASRTTPRNAKETPTLERKDPTLEKLDILGYGPEGQVYITCPFASDHTMDSGITETAYFPAGTRGYEQGHFKCLHAHCSAKGDGEFIDALGILAAEFDVVSDEEVTAAEKVEAMQSRFKVIDGDIFSEMPDPEWIIEDILPECEVVMIYGESGAGKGFLCIDMFAAVALGKQWRGYDVKQRRVVYVAAEGAAGMRKRLRAYKQQHGILFGGTFDIIDGSPNFMKSNDVTALAKSINDSGPTNVIIIDTLAQTTPGADENSSEMNKALAQCKTLHKATGAMIVLIHHAGKDATKGARGWSGMKAAMDAVIEVTRKDEQRTAKITKLKDGEEGAVFPFKLIKNVVGLDRKGREITSCIVEHLKASPKKVLIKGGVQKAVYQAVLDLSADSEPTPVQRVIDEAIKSKPYDPGAKNKPKRDRRRESAIRALNEIKELGLIVVENNMVSLPQNPHDAENG